MKILLFLALGFIVGYIVKDLLTKESEIVYHIKRLRAKDSGVVSVTAEATVENKKEARKTRRDKRRKNK